ncbi:MAG: 23S rRNA (uracil(1939)-C(5))-methyltransferase RlmD [Clostridiales bacterium]|nr:23S rRNA (uracil(1939)-C(5))-methyltransferase RlmD [Clostridiales bacterium]
MLKKNLEYINTVAYLGANGEGILKQDGVVVFVPFVLVGEKIRYKILKVTSKCAYGKVIEVLTPAEERVRPKCPVFGKCGGCQLQHLAYSHQTRSKEDNVRNCFKKIANLDVNVLPTVKCSSEYGYRNKLQLPVADGNEGIVIGFYAENSHRVIPIDDCPINPVWTKTIIECFSLYAKEYGIKGYNDITFTGDLREITVKEIKDNLIITAVVTDENIRGIKYLVSLLEDKLQRTFSLYLNVNTSRSNVIYGDRFILKHGKGYYVGDLRGIKYKIGVMSFMQVNNEMCGKLYSAVVDSVGADETTTVIDAYSGAGLMTAMLAKTAAKAIGIEIVKEATECANELAEMNGISDKMINYNGKCEDLLPSIIKEEREKGNKICLVVDPPRKGIDPSLIKVLRESMVDKIVYVSCMPSTLARDVGLISGSLTYIGNEIKKVEPPDLLYTPTLIRPYDMFPQTKHVETLVVLGRK